jgi:AraC-like DNA-binding protein
LRALGSASPHRDLEIAGALLHWLSYILTSLRAPFDRTYAHDRKVVDKILAAETWANARLKEVITLSQWAKAVGLNEVYFGRIFKRETGMKPMEWLNQRRLQMACQYLSGTRKSVGEIAESCGFANQFYFSRVFRKRFQQSPMEYRRTKF